MSKNTWETLGVSVKEESCRRVRVMCQIRLCAGIRSVMGQGRAMCWYQISDGSGKGYVLASDQLWVREGLCAGIRGYVLRLWVVRSAMEGLWGQPVSLQYTTQEVNIWPVRKWPMLGTEVPL